MDFPTQHLDFLFEGSVELLEERFHLFLALVRIPPIENKRRYFFCEVARGGFEFVIFMVKASDVQEEFIVAVSCFED